MVNIPLFTGFHACQVVQDFFHQQYDGIERHIECFASSSCFVFLLASRLFLFPSYLSTLACQLVTLALPSVCLKGIRLCGVLPIVTKYQQDITLVFPYFLQTRRLQKPRFFTEELRQFVIPTSQLDKSSSNQKSAVFCSSIPIPLKTNMSPEN